MPIQDAKSMGQPLSESDLTDLDSSDSGSLAEFDMGKTKSTPTTRTTSICDDHEELAFAISKPVNVAPSLLSSFSNSHSFGSLTTRKKRRIGPASCEDPNDNTRSTFLTKAASPSSVIDLTSPISTQEPSTSQALHSDYSSTYVTDTLVWIRINLSGMSVQVASDACPKYLWWPAKITSSASDTAPSHALLFGRPPRTSVQSEIPIMSAVDDLRPMRTSKLRKSLWFTAKTFIVGGGQHLDTSKPLKKSEQQELTRAWAAAVKEMLAAEDGYDYSSSDSMNLPDASLAFAPPSKTVNRKLKTMSKLTGQRSAKKKRKHWSDSDSDDTSNTTDDDELRTWTPPDADPDLDIPGELVLADHRHRKIYWPARIIAYIPPAHKRDRPQYRVEYLDEDQADIFRNEFFTSLEDGFATCHLGQHAAPTPVPVYDSPNTTHTPGLPLTHKMPGDFNTFSLFNQLAHVKPVLTAILYGKYVPAQDNHRRWMRGGKSRADVIRESANIRGRMHERQLVDLKNLILEWALGCKAGFVNDDDDDNNDGFLRECAEEVRRRVHGGRDGGKVALLDLDDMYSFHRAPNEAHDVESGMEVNSPAQISCSRGVPQRGSVEYEALTSSDKLKYCMDILLPEAVIQIHLWRSSERDSPDLLDDEEETRLHEIGLKHATWVDWVSTVVLLRERAASAYNRKQPKQLEYNKSSARRTRSRLLRT